jgi:hypothetical protein
MWIRSYSISTLHWSTMCLLQMRSSQVVRAIDCQCNICNGPGFDPSIRRHSGVCGAADEAVLNTVCKKNLKNVLCVQGDGKVCSAILPQSRWNFLPYLQGIIPCSWEVAFFPYHLKLLSRAMEDLDVIFPQSGSFYFTLSVREYSMWVRSPFSLHITLVTVQSNGRVSM